MILVNKARRLAAAAGALVFFAAAQPGGAQEISESHLDAARVTIAAMKATEEFDSILPRAAQALKNELIQKNPNLQEIIIQFVDETTIALAARRADLEREAALAYARVFSEADLKTISDFYASPAGQKLISDGPIVAREIFQAAEIWQRGVARDLAEQVGAKLAEAVGTTPEATPAAPAGGEGTTEEGAADQ